MSEELNKNWKLKLKYGKTTTPYKHFTLIAEGEVDELIEGFSCQKGNAFMSMKVWTESHEAAADMIQSIGEQIGFNITGKIQLFDTDPQQPPEEDPYGYDIKFTTF